MILFLRSDIRGNEMNKVEEEIQLDKHGATNRRPYHAPKLQRYGLLSRLTQTGSGVDTEKGMSGQNPFKRP